MIDARLAAVAKTDQINADDLIGGALTITVVSVAIHADEQQKCSIRTIETPGRAYRPCKTMIRILIAAWGADGRVWVGRKIRIYRDESVRFGDQTGGIRISHLSEHPERAVYSLQESRGKRRPWTVCRIDDDQPTPEQVDAYLVAQGRPPYSGLDDAGQAKVDAWLAGLSPQKRAEICAIKGE